eukprot:2706263-Prymnesium_polylepis.1
MREACVPRTQRAVCAKPTPAEGGARFGENCDRHGAAQENAWAHLAEELLVQHLRILHHAAVA